MARALALASTHSQVELRHLGLTPEDTIRFQRLAGRLLYGDPRLRAVDAVVANVRGQPELWKYSISGDLPLLLMRIANGSDAGLFRELLKVHEYLRLKGFAFDLVALNEHGASYLQDLHDTLTKMVENSPDQGWIDRPGGVFVRRADLMPEEDRTLLRATARVEMVAADGALREQLKRTAIPFEPPPARAVPKHAAAKSRPARAASGNTSVRARIRQRQRRICRRRPAICRRRQPAAPAAAARSVGQRGGKPVVRIRGVGVNHRLHVVGQQPRQPAHAVVERSRSRPGR